MTATKPKRVFKAEDDSDHESSAAAQRHNRVLRASRAFHEAADEVRRCIGEAALTADGQPFESRRWRDYWFIYPNYGGLPRLVKVSGYRYDTKIESRYGDNVVHIRVFSSDRKDYMAYEISDLYADEDKAKAAHLVACKERLTELQVEVAKLKDPTQ